MSDAMTVPRLSMTPSPDLAFDRSRLEPRILHIGPGAFFRAHQADYIDRLNAIDAKWGIVGLSLRSGRLQQALNPQDNLYTLVILDDEIQTRVISSLIDVRTASDANAMDTFLLPEIQLITLTITEKGYCLNHEGTLDRSHPDIARDLTHPVQPKSAIGWLVEGLKRRRLTELPAPIILSCDNLPDNGHKLKAGVLSFATALDADLADWIEKNVLFPCSMVDSITPASDDALRRRIAELQGYCDAWPIQREAFTDWIIEATDDDRMPPFEKVGATIATHVRGFEQAKLRLLNGPHSTLAYLGLARGFDSVSQAMADPEIEVFIREMMRTEIAPSIDAPEGLNVDEYQRDLIKRFQNPAITHKLSQIAWDGSKKLPIRLLDTIADNLGTGRSIAKLSIGIAAWWRFVIRMTRAGVAITDPIANKLSSLANQADHSAENDIALMLSLTEVFPDELIKTDNLRSNLETAYETVVRAEISA